MFTVSCADASRTGGRQFRAARALLLLAWAALPLCANAMELASPEAPTVRFAYLIPSNRTPQVDAVARLQQIVRIWHEWYREQMVRNGVGSLSFRYETEADGVTPLIHVVDLAETDAYLREDMWSRVNQAAAAAGVPVWTPGQVWLLIPETHEQLPDGSIVGGVALGASFGSGNDPGVAMWGSAKLSLAPEGLTDDQVYAGLVIPGIGPYPLVQSVSFPWFEGSTISGLTSTFVGAGLHELTHAFGIAHDWRNDANFHGNLMFNGLRGMRGALYPRRYPEHDARLAYATAVALRTSRYFQPVDASAADARTSAPTRARQTAPGDWAGAQLETRAGRELLGGHDVPDPMPSRALAADDLRLLDDCGDTERPNITVLTSGVVTPVDGLLEIEFLAEDAGGLSAALLRRGGSTIGELPLSGTAVTETFVTPYYIFDEPATFAVAVYDLCGNLRNVNSDVTVAAGFNHAPEPFFKVSPSQTVVGDAVLLSANGTTDPDHSVADLVVEWDLDDDGLFDTEPTTTKTYSATFAEAGPRLIRVRVTDPAGAQFVSTPIALRVDPWGPGDLNCDGLVNSFDIDPFVLALADPAGYALAHPECDRMLADVDGDGAVNVFDIDPFVVLLTADQR